MEHALPADNVGSAPTTAIKESGTGGNAPAQNQSDQEYRTIIQASMDGFWKVAADGRLIDCNEAACAMLGYSREELLALSISDIEMRESEAEVAAHVLRLIAQGHDRFETEHRCKDGSGILVEVSAYCVPGAEAPLLFAFCRDIRERKRAEATLREMQQFKQAILDAVTAQVAVVDRHGVIVEVNAAWCRFARENAAVPGRLPCNVDIATNYLDVCFAAAGEGAAGALEAAVGIQAVLEGRLPKYEQEYTCHAPHVQRWFLMTVTPLEREERRAVISHHDISAPRRLAEELSVSDARIRSILRSAPVGIGVLANRVFVEVNPAFCAMTGYATEELVGRSARMLYPSDAEFERVGEEKYRQISREGVGRIETQLLTKDGRIIDVALCSAPIVPGNPARGITFTVEDITARKQSEQQRLAHEARQRDALIREVHHRIKNHLQGVLGLMANSIARHPEMAEAMDALFTRVNAIAKVYGLQGRKPDAHVRFCDLMETLLEGTPGATPILRRNLSADMEAILSPQEGVPMALVINELITNADKHRHAKDAERPLQASLRIDSDRVTLTITNAPASLPEGFDLATGTGISTGLGLLKALLPRTGASLNYRQEGDAVVAELVLVAPLVNCRARRPDAPED